MKSFLRAERLAEGFALSAVSQNSSGQLTHLQSWLCVVEGVQRWSLISGRYSHSKTSDIAGYQRHLPIRTAVTSHCTSLVVCSCLTSELYELQSRRTFCDRNWAPLKTLPYHAHILRLLRISTRVIIADLVTSGEQQVSSSSGLQRRFIDINACKPWRVLKYWGS